LPPQGRGSYGKVFKGRWKGALVAIKVVEHSGSSGKADIIEGARESLLAASVSHPNVVLIPLLSLAGLLLLLLLLLPPPPPPLLPLLMLLLPAALNGPCAPLATHR